MDPLMQARIAYLQHMLGGEGAGQHQMYHPMDVHQHGHPQQLPMPNHNRGGYPGLPQVPIFTNGGGSPYPQVHPQEGYPPMPYMPMGPQGSPFDPMNKGSFHPAMGGQPRPAAAIAGMISGGQFGGTRNAGGFYNPVKY